MEDDIPLQAKVIKPSQQVFQANLLGPNKRLSNRPLFPLVLQQEALPLKWKQHHQIL